MVQSYQSLPRNMKTICLLLGQWFPMKGGVAPQGTFVNVWTDFSLAQLLGDAPGISRVEPRDAATLGCTHEMLLNTLQ